MLIDIGYNSTSFSIIIDGNMVLLEAVQLWLSYY